MAVLVVDMVARTVCFASNFHFKLIPTCVSMIQEAAISRDMETKTGADRVCDSLSPDRDDDDVNTCIVSHVIFSQEIMVETRIRT